MEGWQKKGGSKERRRYEVRKEVRRTKRSKGMKKGKKILGIAKAFLKVLVPANAACIGISFKQKTTHFPKLCEL